MGLNGTTAPPAPVFSGAGGARIRRSEESPLTVLAFLLPSLVGFVLFIFGPILASIGFSFFRFSGGWRSLEFIGLRNYLRAVHSAEFWGALAVTIRFVAVSVVLQLSIGFVLALFLQNPLRFRNTFRGIIFLPTVLAPIAVGLAFVVILHPEKGPLNQLLVLLGLPPSPWLTSPKTALGSIILVTVWQNAGYYMVIFLAGLISISDSLFESAEIAGANTIQKLRYITIPMLTPTLFFAITMAIIRAFQVFDQVFIMTGGQWGGGPAGATRVLVFDIYINAFIHYDMGYAATESVILLAIVLLITVVQYRRQEAWVNYDAT